ncbi:MAG: histidinol-phosphate transaminase [Gammaproteobacteria bacterium]|nr:histidinol-phosphate transaminase [Gammaproteobacteria bacterium]MDH5801250.1 histidinol-phosphate transaminase [Gammaproteobacteria bacterium]
MSCDNAFVELALPGIQKLSPYQPGKPIGELQREYGLKQVTKLASNENPLGPGPKALEAAKDALPGLHRYPDGNGFELKQALSRVLNVQSNQVTLGNGSNDVLELIARAFAAPSEEIIFSQYAFAVYPLVTQAIGAKAVEVAAKNWGHDLDAMAAAVSEKTKVIFLANPNNPTGTWFGEVELTTFMDKIPASVLVVLDEAYYEYASDPRTGADDYPNALPLLDRYANLILCRTFSKAYGLAGLRVGYCVSHPAVADVLNRIRQPFNVNHMAQCMAVAALEDKTYLDQAIQCNSNGLTQLSKGFSGLGLDAIASVGNFICVRVGDSMAVYERLLHLGVIVRPVMNYRMPEYLRVSVGLEQENAACLTALQQCLES